MSDESNHAQSLALTSRQSGAYNRPPPFKRQKPNPPVVTKYAVPPHVQQNHGQPPQNYGALYSGPGYPQYQGPQEPLPPMSGPPSSQQQWQQHTYSQHYQQAYPQQQQYAQAYQHTGHQHQQHYIQQAAPTPATPHAAQYPHQGSPQAPQANTASYFQNGQYPQQPISQAPSMNHASPGSTVSQITAYQQQQYPISTAATAQPTTHASPRSNVPQTAPIQAQHPASNSAGTTRSQQGSRNSSVSMQSMSVTDKQPSVEPLEGDDDDEEEEDLDKLDVPDIPAVIGKLLMASLEASLNSRIKMVLSQVLWIDLCQQTSSLLMRWSPLTRQSLRMTGVASPSSSYWIRRARSISVSKIRNIGRT